jgi:hypothetical protein
MSYGDEHGSSQIGYFATPMPERCVIVVDQDLPAGLAANAAAVLALTLGAREPALVGADLVDADDRVHPGLFPAGLPVLTAPSERLAALRDDADGAGVGVIAMPRFGQETNDYEAVRAAVARTPASELRFVGVALYGAGRPVRRLTGNLALLR